MTDVSATTLPTNPTPMNVPIRRRAVQPVPVAAVVEPEIERVAEAAEVANEAEQPSQHANLSVNAENMLEDEPTKAIDLSPRRRGRPKGSKNVTIKASEPAVGRVKREPRVVKAKPSARRVREARVASTQHEQLAMLGGLFIEATKQGISTNELIENMRATVAAFDALTKSE